MYCNVAAESTGRVLATRLYNSTTDAGMKDMLSFLIARDTMRQQQWLAVIEDLGGLQNELPMPNSFPQSQEARKFSYAFFATERNGAPPEPGRWTEGPSMDGKGRFSVFPERADGRGPRARPGARGKRRAAGADWQETWRVMAYHRPADFPNFSSSPRRWDSTGTAPNRRVWVGMPAPCLHGDELRGRDRRRANHRPREIEVLAAERGCRPALRALTWGYGATRSHRVDPG